MPALVPLFCYIIVKIYISLHVALEYANRLKYISGAAGLKGKEKVQ